MRMNHSSEAWHTPRVKGTSSLKSLRKRPLPSLPAKPEWRAKVRPGEAAGARDWRTGQPLVVPEGILPVGRVLRPCCLLFLGSINTLKTLQPDLTFASGLVFPESLSQKRTEVTQFYTTYRP